MTEKNPELELKKWEVLYELTKSEVASVEDRFDKVEEKAARHFTILTVIFGVAALGADSFIEIFQGTCSATQLLFVISYILLMVTTIAAMTEHLLTLKFITLKHLKIGNELLARVEKISYVTSLFRLIEENNSIIKENLEVLAKKVEHANTAFRYTKYVIGLAASSGILYVLYMTSTNV